LSSGGARVVDVEDPISSLDRSLAAVGGLIRGIRSEQWSAPTPCSEWTVRRIVSHLAGMNRVFAAMLAGEPPPQRGDDPPDDEFGQVYEQSAEQLLAAFRQPGVLDRSFTGPLGSATGSDRLQIRLYDLLAHGWDLSRATGLPLELPDEAAEQALTFVRTQLDDDARPGRFAPAQPVPDDASSLDRLVAYLGRTV
jgi:uncharacterized protein (TIGR03086 family)